MCRAHTVFKQIKASSTELMHISKLFHLKLCFCQTDLSILFPLNHEVFACFFFYRNESNQTNIQPAGPSNGECSKEQQMLPRTRTKTTCKRIAFQKSPTNNEFRLDLWTAHTQATKCSTKRYASVSVHFDSVFFSFCVTCFQIFFQAKSFLLKTFPFFQFSSLRFFGEQQPNK